MIRIPRWLRNNVEPFPREGIALSAERVAVAGATGRYRGLSATGDREAIAHGSLADPVVEFNSDRGGRECDSAT